MNEWCDEEPDSADWTFLSNHAHVLLVIARDQTIRLREVASLVGITERAVQRIVKDLESGGCLVRERMGRRNRYQLQLDLPLRHPIERHRTIRELLALLLPASEMATLESDALQPDAEA